MLHAIIIDDEYNGIRSLELLIKRFVPDVKIVALTSNPFEGVGLINNYRPDIVFLDINMPSLNGFELLEKLEHKKFNLIFITAYQEYAIKAIKKSATDYLLKPIDVDKLISAVQRVKQSIIDDQVEPDAKKILKEIASINSIRIPLPSKGSIEFVPPSMIIYVEATSNTCKVFLTNMLVVEVNKSLKEYESILCRDELFFMRVHHSFIVNLNFVNRYVKDERGYIVVHEKKIIYISRQKKEEFFNMIELRNWR